MSDAKRATIYFDPALHKALRLKSAETQRSVSELVNKAVRLLLLQEDVEDLEDLDRRANEPTVMSSEISDKERRWGDAWAVAGERLERMRVERLRRMTTAEAAEITRRLLSDPLPRLGERTTGLIEQQRLFRKLRRVTRPAYL